MGQGHGKNKENHIFALGFTSA